MLFLFGDIKRKLIQRWEGAPQRQQHMQTWMNAKFEGLNLRFDELRSNALNVFAFSFVAAFFVALPTFAHGLSLLLEIASEWLKGLATT